MIAIKILSTQEYSQSYRVVAIIAFSYYLWGLAEFYGLGLLIANKMLLNSLIVAISAIFNITFNYLLIPKFGIYGAAIATCIAYFITNILYYLTGRRYYNLNITLLEPYKCGIIFLALDMIYMLYKSNCNNMLLEVLLNIVLCMAYGVLSIIFRIISWESIKKLINRVKMKMYKKVCR